MLLRRAVSLLVVWIVVAAWTASPALAEESRAFVGSLVGISTLSADGHAVTDPAVARVSLYKPENGPAVNAFAGWHLGNYFSLQGNYIWNPNDLTLLSSIASAAGGGFYEQPRTSTQHAVVADALLYFRALQSGIRPYLSTGIAVIRFSSNAVGVPTVSGVAPPDGAIRSIRVGLRVAVGIDMALGRAWSFRYSFSETISGNPISARLTPRAPRNLANFQNLFGVVLRL